VDLLQNIRTKLRQAEKHVEETYNLLDEAVTEIETAIKNVEREKTPLEEQARTIRRDVEGRKEGAGAAARQLAGLREQVTQLDALKTVQTQKLVGPTAKARVNSYGGYQASDFIH
jgi:chromosome segregation ATPase